MHYFHLTTFRAFLLVLGMILPGLSYGQQTANFNPVFQANGQSLFEANGGTPAGLNLDKQFLGDGKVSQFVDEKILDLLFLKGGIEFGAYFQLKELNGGQVDITYPLDITIQYPDANTFGCNDWIEITTDCTVGAGYDLAVTPPTLDFELGTSFTGGVSASIGNLEEISAPEGFGSATSSNWQDFGDGWEDPFFGLNTNTGITWPWDYIPGLSAPSGAIPGSFPVTIPAFIEDAIFLGGTIDNPFAGDGPDNLTEKKLSDNSLKNFVDIHFSPLNFQQYFTGIPLSIGFDAGIASVDFTAFNTPLGLEIAQRRKVEFEGEVNIQFAFSQTLQYEEVDPGTNSVVNTGTGSTATIKAGHTLRVRYPDGAPEPTMVTPSFIMVNDKLSTAITEEVVFEVGLEILKGELEVGGFEQEICEPNIPPFNFDGVQCLNIEFEPIMEEFFIFDDDLHFPVEDIVIYDETFDVTDGAFEDIQGTPIQLQPDQQAPVATYTTGSQVINLSTPTIDLDLDDFLDSFTDQEGGGTQILEASAQTYSCADVGPTVYSWTGSDNRCNEADYDRNFTLMDTGLPVVNTKSYDLYLNANGEAVLNPEDVNNNSTDNCGIADYELDKSVFNCNDLGPQTVMLKATDLSGNEASNSASIQVIDAIAPTANCKDITVYLDEEGLASITPGDVDDASFDACGISERSISKGTFDCDDLGSNTITLGLKDGSDNQSQCNATVTVRDNIAPVVFCKSFVKELDPYGNASLTPDDLFDEVNSFDNCTINLLSVAPNTFNCSTRGEHIVTLQATDDDGNNVSCEGVITVVEGTALPAPWTTADIGDQGDGSTYSFDPCTRNNPANGDFTLSSGANNLGDDTSDDVSFIGQTLCGNGGIQARVREVTGGYVGLMIRESDAPGARKIAFYSNGTNMTRWETRYQTGVPHNDTHLYASFPFWLRIVRQGNWFRGYYRNAGNNWVLIHQVYMDLPECAEVGIATFTHTPNGTVNAVVSNVTVQGASPSLVVPHDGPEVAADHETLARIFPNPSNGQFTVDLGQPTLLPITVSLINTMGQLIEQRQFEPGAQQLPWQTQNLPNGLYFLEIPKSDGTTQTLKWMKQ